MSINKKASLVAKLRNTCPLNEHSHRVYEQRVFTTNNLKLVLKSDDVGYRFKIRGLFIPRELEYSQDAAAEIWIDGFKVSSIPMRLISALNNALNYTDFSFDVFFCDSIYLHLICLCELRFVNMPKEITEVEVLFDGCWLSNKELMRMNDSNFDHFFKQVMLPGKLVPNNLSIQNVLVCENKANIKSVTYDCYSKSDSSHVSVFDYDERLVDVYGVSVNDKITAFSMNPGKPWDCHYPEGNLNICQFENENLVIERKRDDASQFDVYLLATNQLHYEKGMASVKHL
uniref:Uncharacterized protein n=1 Tax=viral metagenome TaxID=1070528 RepID=A0A6C0BUZ5_9ZZZZ